MCAIYSTAVPLSNNRMMRNCRVSSTYTVFLKVGFARTRTGSQMCRWCDVVAGSSAPILPNRNLFSQNQHEIAGIGKQIIMVGRPEVLSQSLPSFSYKPSLVYQKSLNVSEQTWNVYWSKV